ncbi:hypothetical protein [Amycolatopsis plumensis]|uniref:Beta-lactamase class A n=1 Tax=Amycolatopsis plumensis TaxID=236508 RepID=A0ABV5UEK1_9PSEU
MHRRNATLLAGTAAAAVVAMLTAAAAMRPPDPTQARLTAPPALTTSVATTATAAPPEDAGQGVPTAADLADLVPGELSVVVHDRRTGRDLVSHRPDAAYPAASLVKLLIALEALRRGEPAGVVAELLSRSDDEVAGRLWTKLGGPAIVTGWAARIGLTSTRPPEDPGEWGGTVVSAADLARVYRYVLDTAPAATRQTVLRALGSAAPRSADGSDQLYGIAAAVTATGRAVNQGWSCCDPDRLLHTSGVVGDGRFVVVVLTAQRAGTSRASAAQRVTAVSKALSGAFGWS